MPAKPKWSLATLERALRRELVARGRVRSKKLDRVSAQVEWTDDGPISADFDPLWLGQVSAVAHELMHIVLEPELAAFAEYGKKDKEDLGEIALNAWEKAIVERIQDSSRRTAWWRKAIARSMLPKRRQKRR